VLAAGQGLQSVASLQHGPSKAAEAEASGCFQCQLIPATARPGQARMLKPVGSRPPCSTAPMWQVSLSLVQW
jgi:hypothetical protein